MIVYEIGFRLETEGDQQVRIPGGWFTDPKKAQSLMQEATSRVQALTEQPLGETNMRGQDLIIMLGVTSVEPYLRAVEVAEDVILTELHS